MPDGSSIPATKVDSIAKAWNGLTMQRDLSKNPVEIHLYRISSQAAKEVEMGKIKQETDLRQHH